MHTQQDDVVQLLQLERRVMASIRAKDVAALRPLLAEGFVYRTAVGEDVGIEAFLAGIVGLPVAIVSLHGDRVRSLLLGDTAVLTGIQVAVTRDGEGLETQSRGAFTDVFVRQGGEWKLLLAYGVDLPDRSSQPAEPPPRASER